MRIVQAVLQKALDERLYMPDLVSSFLHYAAGTLLIFIWSLACAAGGGMVNCSFSTGDQYVPAGSVSVKQSCPLSICHHCARNLLCCIWSLHMLLGSGPCTRRWQLVISQELIFQVYPSVCLSLFCHVVIEYNKLHISQN